jgi:hypothetical protein
VDPVLGQRDGRAGADHPLGAKARIDAQERLSPPTVIPEIKEEADVIGRIDRHGDVAQADGCTGDLQADRPQTVAGIFWRFVALADGLRQRRDGGPKVRYGHSVGRTARGAPSQSRRDPTSGGSRRRRLATASRRTGQDGDRE